jgi:hypothetical protein
MPPLIWASDPIVSIQDFESRHESATAGALFAWAVGAVESLHYLDDIDRAFDTSGAAIGGHRPDIVDVSHARWATGTAATAIDLCAAGLGRVFCNNNSNREFALAQFDPSEKKAQQHRARLPSDAQKWVDTVLSDPAFREIKRARHWLTHSRLKRHFTMSIGGPPQRIELEITAKVPVRTLIEDVRDCATRHVKHLVNILPQI